jgi:hypothetical protein
VIGTRLVSAKADVNRSAAAANVKRSGRSQNEARTRQAVRGIKQMFREDGLLRG